MKVQGTIYTEVDIDSFTAIKSLCQTIGVVDENGTLVGEFVSGRIIRRYQDENGKLKVEVLYDQPFDIKLALALMNVYELSKNYLILAEHINNRTGGNINDYQTVKKLQLYKEEYEEINRKL